MIYIKMVQNVLYFKMMFALAAGRYERSQKIENPRIITIYTKVKLSTKTFRIMMPWYISKEFL